MVLMELYKRIGNFDDIRARTSSSGLLLAAMRLESAVSLLTGRKGFSALFGRNVLDLGCGSENNTKPGDIEFPYWAPHFARLAAAHGANVFGIDIYPASESDANLYTHIEANIAELVASERLALLPHTRNTRFDIIHAHLLFTSHELEGTLKPLGVTEEVFMPKLISQLESLRKQGGIIMVEGAWIAS